MHIETVAVEALRPYERNARTHSKRQIRQIAKSIERFGFNNAVLVDEQRRIIAGHGRVAAAKLLGIKEVPTVRLAHLSEAEKRAYILADNRLAEKAGWDREILAIELQALVDLDFEVELTGFETAEVDLILEEANEAVGTGGCEDEIPTYGAGPAVTRPGDLWNLGPHRLLCADARDPAAYGRLLDGVKAEFVFTDPPYNVQIDGHVCGLGRIRHANFAMGCGEMSEAEFTAFLEAVFRMLADNTVDGSIHEICMDWRHVPEMLAAGHAVYDELKNLCVWNKSNAGMGTFYRSKHELVFIWKSGTAPHLNTFELGQYGRSRSNVWDYAGVNSLKPGRLEELAMASDGEAGGSGGRCD
jgi:ParB/Sulfiredoxin domain